MDNKSTLVRTMKPGESIELDGGRVRIVAEQVPGRRVSVRLELHRDVRVEKGASLRAPRNTEVAQMA